MTSEQQDIAIADVGSPNPARRLTFGGTNRFPLWTPDGQRVVFQTDREGDPSLFWQRADGTGPAERLTAAAAGESHAPDAWSPDGKRLLFTIERSSSGSRGAIWALSLDTKKAELIRGEEGQSFAWSDFSPDGRWFVYQSNESGRNEIYVEPFPPTGARYQVSREGGTHPRWSPNGREIVFRAPMSRSLNLVAVTTTPQLVVGTSESVDYFGALASLRRTAVQGGGPTGVRGFDLTRDGKHVILVSRPLNEVDTAAGAHFKVIVNWFDDLRQRTNR